MFGRAGLWTWVSIIAAANIVPGTVLVSLLACYFGELQPGLRPGTSLVATSLLETKVDVAARPILPIPPSRHHELPALTPKFPMAMVLTEHAQQQSIQHAPEAPSDPTGKGREDDHKTFEHGSEPDVPQPRSTPATVGSLTGTEPDILQDSLTLARLHPVPVGPAPSMPRDLQASRVPVASSPTPSADASSPLSLGEAAAGSELARADKPPPRLRRAESQSSGSEVKLQTPSVGGSVAALNWSEEPGPVPESLASRVPISAEADVEPSSMETMRIGAPGTAVAPEPLSDPDRLATGQILSSASTDVPLPRPRPSKKTQIASRTQAKAPSQNGLGGLFFPFGPMARGHVEARGQNWGHKLRGRARSNWARVGWR